MKQGRVMNGSSIWSLESDALARLNTDCTHFSVASWLLVVVGRSATGQWSLTSGPIQWDLRFESGNCTGFQQRSEGTIVTTLESELMSHMTTGLAYEDALDKVFTDLVRNILTLPRTTTISLCQEDLGRAVPLHCKLGATLVSLLQASQTEEALLREYGANLSTPIQWINPEFPLSQMGFTLQQQKQIKTFSNKRTVGQALDVVNRVTAQWKDLDAFCRLGLFTVESTSEMQSVLDGSPQESIATESADPKRLAELNAYLELISTQPAYVTFGLEAPNQVNDQHIGKVFRDLSKGYHPDRHRSVGSDEKDLIGDIYAQINEVYAELQDEGLRGELRKRLDVERRGLQYVSEEDEKKSELLHAQAKFHFRKRQYQDAHKLLSEAFTLNPYNWRINTLKLRTEAELGLKPKAEVAQVLSENKDARGSDRVEILYQAGVYFLQVEDTTKAYDLFAKVVELDDGHIDAKRHLHLQKKKPAEPEKEEKAGFFSRLFGKK